MAHIPAIHLRRDGVAFVVPSAMQMVVCRAARHRVAEHSEHVGRIAGLTAIANRFCRSRSDPSHGSVLLAVHVEHLQQGQVSSARGNQMASRSFLSIER